MRSGPFGHGGLRLIEQVAEIHAAGVATHRLNNTLCAISALPAKFKRPKDRSNRIESYSEQTVCIGSSGTAYYQNSFVRPWLTRFRHICQ